MKLTLGKFKKAAWEKSSNNFDQRYHTWKKFFLPISKFISSVKNLSGLISMNTFHL